MKKTNHKSLLTLTLFALMLLGAACSDTDTHPNTDEPMIDPPGTLLASDLSRIMDPQVSAEDAKTLVEDNTTFALNLFDEVRDEHENLFFSPHSISIALGMTYAGARANTELEMAGAMEFSLSQELLHPAFNDLDLTLKEAAADNFDLRIVNQLWGQEGEVFVPEFLDSLALHYGAGMRLMDFLGAPEASRATINEWVEDATEERIKDLLPEGSITSDTRLVLTNAIYFLADWSLQFEKEQTYAGAFTLLNGGSSTVDFMNQVATFDYYADGDYQAIALPYAGETATLLAILP
ncbi:serpin family protein, partial [Myxococcota bacterium]|nr:serpin family protein [Myxococcota bacterium]